jgi:hypothetical protein
MRISTIIGPALVVLASATLLLAQHGSVLNTVHNLSASGPGEVRALEEDEVCKFCHIPHSSVVPEQLWARRLSDARYQVPEIRPGGSARISAPQPDGSSRLCLSCHDGTVALGDIGGRPRRIAMMGGDHLSSGRKGYIGTDLSGSHPISFVVPDQDPDVTGESGDMALRPLSAIRADPDVPIDTNGKMQCTTCHDPHTDRYYQKDVVPRFWVKPSVQEVCLTCHQVR